MIPTHNFISVRKICFIFRISKINKSITEFTKIVILITLCLSKSRIFDLSFFHTGFRIYILIQLFFTWIPKTDKTNLQTSSLQTIWKISFSLYDDGLNIVSYILESFILKFTYAQSS